MKSLNKKGMAGDQLVIIVLIIVGFLLIAGVTYGFTKKAEQKSPELLCYNSIGIRAASVLRLGQVDVPFSTPICETIDVELKGDRGEMKKQLAELMTRCWWMFHEGRYEEILNNPDEIRNIFNLAGDNKCFVCYNVLIDEKEIPGGPIPVKEMEQFLRETKYPKYKDITYLDYIQSYGGPGSALVLNGIGARESYGIVFLAKNKVGAGLGWSDYVTSTLMILYAPVAGIAAPIVLTVEALKAKRTFYDSDERDLSVIVLDDLKSVNYNDCDSTLYEKPIS